MKRLKFLLANTLIVAFLYCNAAVVFNYPLTFVTTRWSLPLPINVYDWFVLFGVFSSYEEVNRGIEIYGVADSRSGSPEAEVVQLDVTDYLPFPPGELQSRAQVIRHAYAFGLYGQEQAWAVLAAKIRARHNRLHPNARVRAIGIVELSWPRSLEDYDGLKTDTFISHHLLFAE